MTNPGAQTRKACWVQALAGSNPASPAMLTCRNAISHRPETVSTSRLVSVLSHFACVRSRSRLAGSWLAWAEDFEDDPQQQGHAKEQADVAE